MNFIKHFCRLITDLDLEDDDVIEFFDIVQSVCPVKLITAYSDDEIVKVDVIAYTGSEQHQNIYEIILSEQLSLEEGEQISDLLLEEFDFDFDFETSMEI